MLRVYWGMCLVIVLVASLPAASRAQSFRMETDVYEGDAAKPFSQTLTLFTDGMAYDFILVGGQPAEITVFDMQRGRVLLLNPEKKVKTTLTHEELIKATTKIKLEAPPANKVFHFAANPAFEVAFSDDNQLTLKSEPINYVVKCTKPEMKGAARAYQEFADWTARLNSLRPGNLPPFARMELSREMAERDLIPEEISRTVLAPARFGNRKLELISRHPVFWILSHKDQQRISRVAEQISDYEAVPFAQFIEPEKLAKKP